MKQVQRANQSSVGDELVKTKQFDLVVIGSGAGGYEAAIKASLKGMKVAIVEKGKIGGTCLNAGCIPTKALYQTAKTLNELKTINQLGIVVDNYQLDFNQVTKRKDAIVKQLGENISTLLNSSWVQIFEGAASFIDDERLHISHPVENKIIHYKHCLLATGSKDIILPIPGHDLPNVLTSKGLLELTEVPKKLLIIGGGVIGCEMASIYQQFGSEVIVIEAMDRLLNQIDKDLSSRLKSYMKKEGITVHTSTKVTEIEQAEDGLLLHAFDKKGNEITFDASHVLMAVGRYANTKHLNAEAVGIEIDRHGFVVDDHFMTTKDSVYAVGDCIGGMMLAHTATYQSYKVVNHLLNQNDTIDLSLVPACVFTFPEIANVGLTEEMARESYPEVRIKKALYRANGKANAMGKEEGFIKVISQDGKLIGTHIIGEAASTIIHQASSLIQHKIPIKEAVEMVHAHPTLSEVLLDALKGLLE